MEISKIVQKYKTRNKGDAMLTYQMNNRDEKSKYYYLYQMIKKDIVSGILRENEKLPSKRALAEHLGVSLITVENAYHMLKQEGYIESRERSGYFVCEINAIVHSTNETKQKLIMLEEDWKQEKREEDEMLKQESLAAENGMFPYSLYFKTVRSVISEYGEKLMRRSPNEGCAILRNRRVKKF